MCPEHPIVVSKCFEDGVATFAGDDSLNLIMVETY
jgi:hypothetical protein